VDQLTKLRGADFDKTYTKDMVAGHEKAVKTFEDASKNAKDPEIKEWAGKQLKTLEEHLEQARATAKDIK
jgi:putative membrane protein